MRYCIFFSVVIKSLKSGAFFTYHIPLGTRHISGAQYSHVASGYQQFSSVSQSSLTLCDPMDCSTPGLPVHHQLPELTQTYAH